MSDLTLAPSSLAASAREPAGVVELAAVSLVPDGRRGLTPPSGRFEPTTFLSDVVIALGLADDERVEGALKAARNPGQTLERVLVDSQVVTEDELARALAERHGIDHIDLTVYPSDPGVEELLEPALARSHDALPVSRLDEQTVLLAMAEPADWLAADEIERVLGLRVRPAAAARGAVRASIDAAARRERRSESPPARARAELAPVSPAPSPPVSPAGPAREGTVAPAPAPVSAKPPQGVEPAELERWLLGRWLDERIARLERERAELERERAEVIARPLG